MRRRSSTGDLVEGIFPALGHAWAISRGGLPNNLESLANWLSTVAGRVVSETKRQGQVSGAARRFAPTALKEAANGVV